MAANYLHGVETIEIDKGPRPIRGVKTAVVGLIGTAPIWAVDAEDATVNKPVMVLSDRDAAKYFGPAEPGYTIPQALDAVFDQGKGIVIVVNVFNPAVHKTAQAPAAVTFGVDGTVWLGRKGISALTVTSQDQATTYVAGADYEINPVTGILARKDGGAIAAGATVLAGFDYADPTKVMPSDIIGAETADGGTGMQALKGTYNTMGFFAKILIAPAYCTQVSVASELLVMANALRAVALVDAPIGTTFPQAIAGRGPSGTINFNFGSERMVLCYPHLKVYDLATDTERLEPFSQRLAGVIAARDVDKGYHWSPSNVEILGITGVERGLTAMINDPNSEVNLLNENGIVTVFNSFGSGLRVWGNRSAAWPVVTHPKNFINVRRTADVLYESIEYSMLQFIDQPISDALIDSIRESVNAFIRTLIQRGALIDGRCVYDPANNPPTQLALGHLTFDIEFMPPTPAERITFQAFINIDLLKNLGA